MSTELDPTLQQRVVALAEAYPAKWEEVLDGRTEARSWVIGMTAFGLEEAIDRKAVQAYIDDQVSAIRDLDAAEAKGLKAWKHSRLPALTRACGVPDAAPVEDVVAMAVVEGTAAEYEVVRTLDEPADDHLPSSTIALRRVDTSPDDGVRVIDFSRTQLMPDGSLSIVTTPADLNDTEEWGTLDMKGPPVETKVSFTKAELAELLEQAFTDGVGCDSRYDGDTDNLMLCLGNILWDAFYDADADDNDDEHLAPSSEPVVTLSDQSSIPKFAGLDLETGEPVTLEPGQELSRPTIVSMQPQGRVIAWPNESGGPPRMEFVTVDAEDIVTSISSLKPEIDYDQLGGWLYEIISSAGVCTYDEARPERPFHLDETIAPFTDGGTTDEAEHFIAKAIDRGLEKFRDGMKLPDVDVQAYKAALAFEPE